MTISIEIFDLFNNSNKINLFVIMLNEEKYELFDRRFNVLFNVDFLN